MSKFYDAKDNADLERVESLLRKGGIEYFVAESGQGAGIASQIEVAEEDVPMAEQLVSGGNFPNASPAGDRSGRRP